MEKHLLIWIHSLIFLSQTEKPVSWKFSGLIKELCGLSTQLGMKVIFTVIGIHEEWMYTYQENQGLIFGPELSI